jgi:hypothetical protein
VACLKGWWYRSQCGNSRKDVAVQQLVTVDETLADIDAALDRMSAENARSGALTPQRGRRIREILSPQANGDQDTW